MLSMVVRRRLIWLWCTTAMVLLVGACRREPTVSTQPLQTESRTEFTERIENFFEYQTLTPGKPAEFLIHLTDLSDGTPVEKADVTLTVRPERDGRSVEAKAKVGRVTGIYVAEVSVPAPGRYVIEFHVKNAKIDERMVLDGFATGGSS